MAGDIVGSASHGDRSTDRIAANTVSTAATANSSDTADIADIGNPNMGRSTSRMPVPVRRDCPREAKQAV
jgi:hypothetical protein